MSERVMKITPLFILFTAASLFIFGCGGGDPTELQNNTTNSTTNSSPTDTSTTGGSTSSDTSTPTTPTNNLITSINPSDYLIDTLAMGKNVYIDRSFTYTAIPDAYAGMTYIQTANADKASAGSSFASFEVNTDVTIYVGYDSRNSAIPNWLSSWAATGDSLQTSDAVLDLYQKAFSQGTVVLGGNDSTTNSMYIVIVDNNNVSQTPSTGTGTATLSWTPPMFNTDGSTLNDLAGYKIYYGTSSGNYTNTITINNVGITSYVINNLTPNIYFFVITAFDSSGNESSYSLETSKQIP